VSATAPDDDDGGGRHVAIYRRLIALYPKGFRAEYGPDLIAHFARQLHDDGPLRTWGRTGRDLVVTVPTQHAEARMHRPSNTAVATALGFVAAVAALCALVVGRAAVLLVGLAIAVAAGTAARWTWRAAQPVREDGDDLTRHWWRFLAAGAAVLGITFGSMALWPDADLGGNAYALAFLGIATGLVLAGGGVLLGLGHAVSDWRASSAQGSAS
jgi:hypothetical protein